MSKPETTTPETKPSPAPAPAPAPRSHFVIADELAAAKAKFVELEKANREYHEKRRHAITRRTKLEESWARDNPGSPFDPDIFNPPASVPPADAPAARAFHKHHYTIASLAAELEAAKADATR